MSGHLGSCSAGGPTAIQCVAGVSMDAPQGRSQCNALFYPKIDAVMGQHFRISPFIQPSLSPAVCAGPVLSPTKRSTPNANDAPPRRAGRLVQILGADP